MRGAPGAGSVLWRPVRRNAARRIALAVAPGRLRGAAGGGGSGSGRPALQCGPAACPCMPRAACMRGWLQRGAACRIAAAHTTAVAPPPLSPPLTRACSHPSLPRHCRSLARVRPHRQEGQQRLQRDLLAQAQQEAAAGQPAVQEGVLAGGAAVSALLSLHSAAALGTACVLGACRCRAAPPRVPAGLLQRFSRVPPCSGGRAGSAARCVSAGPGACGARSPASLAPPPPRSLARPPAAAGCGCASAPRP